MMLKKKISLKVNRSFISQSPKIKRKMGESGLSKTPTDVGLYTAEGVDLWSRDSPAPPSAVPCIFAQAASVSGYERCGCELHSLAGVVENSRGSQPAPMPSRGPASAHQVSDLSKWFHTHPMPSM